MHPVGIIALSEIGFQSTVNGLFRVNGFLDALAANLGKPCSYGFGFWRGDRLHNTKKLFCIRHISQSHFPIWSSHFELYDFFVQFNGTFCFQLSLQITPISSRILAACQRTNHIDNREIPFFLIFIPSCANLLIFKKLDFFLFAHSVRYPFFYSFLLYISRPAAARTPKTTLQVPYRCPAFQGTERTSCGQS